MSRKTLILFTGLLTTIIGLTILRTFLKGSPLLIIGASTVISLIAALISIAFASSKRNNFLIEDESVLKSKLINPKQAYKLSQAIYKISQKSEIRIPNLSVFKSDLRVAYSYQLNPRSSYIKFSNTLINNSCNKSLIGILAHEVCHIKNRDSWKSILRFVNWVFVLSILFFFIKHSSVLLLPIIIYVELSKMRDQEFKSDIQAVNYTALDNILHSLLDSYILQLQGRQRLVNDFKNSTLSTRLRKGMKLLEYDFTVIMFKIFGTHPTWRDRIENLLKSQGIHYTEKEFELFIKKTYNFRQKYGFNRSIDWNKIGIFTNKINNSIKN